jgi:tetratricopeptide (TPR) repeat protein
MRHGTVVYRFGAFELDPARRVFVCAGTRIPLTDPQWAVLLLLVENAPAVVLKDALARAGWGGNASDNTIEQAVSRIRKVLRRHDPSPFIAAASGGYRFLCPVERVEPPDPIAAAGLDAGPLKTFVQGKRELTTLGWEPIQEAGRSFQHTLRHAPDYAPAHVGLANVFALSFEATRFAAACDPGTIALAVDHSRQAVALDPASADAWSTLGFALYLDGDVDAAAVAAHKAVALDPHGWRHQLRRAYVSWGEERIEAARAVLLLCPGLALAHWLIATVLVARGAFAAALIELRAGCAAQDKQPSSSTPYPAVGLHLLHGLVLAALGRFDEAIRELEMELAGRRDQLYARECAANTCYALGAIHLRRGDRAAADAAFRRALEEAPGHLFSLAALGRPLPVFGATDPRVTDAMIARAIELTRSGRHREAAVVFRQAIESAPAPNAGWILPVEPILDAAARPDIWSDPLSTIQRRAI